MIGAGEYGKALFLLTEERNTTDHVREELDMLAELIKENPSYTKLLDTPALSKEERVSLIDGAFSAFDEDLLNFIKILAEARCAHLICGVREAYLALYYESRGILLAEAITAVPLTEEQSAAIKKKLEEKTLKPVILKNTVDRSILGGVKLRYAGIQLDGSVKTRLDKFEKALTSVIV